MKKWLITAVLAVVISSDPALRGATAAEPTDLPDAPTVPTTIDDLKLIQSRVEAVTKIAVNATVAVIIEGSQGSGVIVSKDGYILTAGHVSGKPGTNIRVIMPDGRRLRAKSLGANNSIDSGMIKITDPPNRGKGGGGGGDFPFVTLGTAKKLNAGQWLIAIGHPGGYMQGRPPVVRLGRVLRANPKAIVTDNPLISGDSGGPLFDLDGKLVGINSRIESSVHTNIHVPIDTFIETWDRLAKGEEWGGTWLGATVRLEDKGIVVRRVHPNTSAAKAGLKEGDIILHLNGRRLKDVDELASAIEKKKPGDPITLEVQRDSKKLELFIKLGTAIR
ncbi:MAG: S1C family serine protease [Phycisphaerales bacterium]|nr:S1C family serine protease [Phycisphaerales bacterium]